MKITPVAGPTAAQPQTTPKETPRDRAVKAYMGNRVDPEVDQAQATERARNIAAITAGTPAPANYVQQAQEIQAQRQPIETTEEITVNTASIVDEIKEVEATPLAAQEKPLSEKYQLLARKERALRQQTRLQQETLRAKELELRQKEEALQAKEREFSQGYISKQRLKDETLSALAEAEISYDDITQKHLDRPQTDPATLSYIQRLEAKLSKLEAGIEETKKNYTDNQTQAYQAAIKQIKTDVTSLVNSDPAFEAIKATHSVSDVVELIEKTYKEDGILMSTEEACQEVEEYLIDESLKLARLNKIQSRLKPAPAVQAPAPKQQAPQQPQPMKTITNAAGSTSQLGRRERAILAAQGLLNKA